MQERAVGRGFVVPAPGLVEIDEAADGDGQVALERGGRGQVALRFVLSNPDVSCAIIGSSELHHIDEALAAEAMGPLPPAVLARLDALYASDFGGR